VIAGGDGRFYEVRWVLAATYVRKTSPCLTHAVEVDARGYETRVLCRNVQLDSICDSGATTSVQEAAGPTCVTCAKRLAKARKIPGTILTMVGYCDEGGFSVAGGPGARLMGLPAATHYLANGSDGSTRLFALPLPTRHGKVG